MPVTACEFKSHPAYIIPFGHLSISPITLQVYITWQGKYISYAKVSIYSFLSKWHLMERQKKPDSRPASYMHNRQTYSASFFFIEVVIFCSSLSKSTIIVSPSPTEARIIISAISSSRYFWIARFNGRAPNWIS